MGSNPTSSATASSEPHARHPSGEQGQGPHSRPRRLLRPVPGRGRSDRGGDDGRFRPLPGRLGRLPHAARSLLSRGGGRPDRRLQGSAQEPRPRERRVLRNVRRRRDYARDGTPREAAWLARAGTRDLLLSNAVRVHRKLLRSGVPATPEVFEGESHAQCQFDDTVPETRKAFTEIADFFGQHLGH